MARRIPTLVGEHANGQIPPPSTIAAQIVHNQTRQNAPPPQNGAAASFKDLLQEILTNPDAAQETDVLVNAKLISVVAEAGLDVLTTDDPFAQWDELLSQAIDSIRVIETTVQRQPGVLLTRVAQDGPPLLPLLLARLFSVCGRAKCKAIPVAKLLGCTFDAFSRSIELWKQAETLRQVIRASVEDLVSALEVVQVPFVAVSLPPGRSVVRIWPQSESMIALPHGSQASIVRHDHAFMLALELSTVEKTNAPWICDVHLRLQHLLGRYRNEFERCGRYSAAITALLRLPDNIPILTYVVNELSMAPLDQLVQQETARTLAVHLHTSTHHRSAELLLPVLTTLASSERFQNLHQELRTGVALWLMQYLPTDQLTADVLALLHVARQESVAADTELQYAFKQLAVDRTDAGLLARPSKRRRLAQESPSDYSDAFVRRTTRLLTGIESNDLTALPDVATSVYRTLDESDQCASWDCISELARRGIPEALQTILLLLNLPELQQSKRARVMSLLAVKAVVMQSSDEARLDLTSSVFGQVCLRSLHSSIRELRVVAGQTLPLFLQAGLSTGLRERNRRVALDYLRSLSKRDVLSEQETLILAWGQIALMCGERELNLTLLRLIDYLGHSNTLVCGLAFVELEKIAEAKDSTPEELFRPFWRSVAVTVTQDLHLRPQKAQQLCDLLGMSVNNFLVLTQRETVPILVLTKRKDVLQRIAAARGSSTSVQDLCLQPRTNLAAILALLLAQASDDVEDNTLEHLTEVAHGFRDSDLTSLVKLDPVLIACEMLKNIGDEHVRRKSRAYQGFQAFTSIAERQPGQGKKTGRSSKGVVSFLEGHMLGIMAHFSDIIEKNHENITTVEKLRCLRAVAEMVGLAKGHISMALPQVRACLQSALEIDLLRDTAFTTWLALTSSLESEDLALLVDQTFALVLQYWSSFSSEVQQLIHERIALLLKTHNDMMRDKVMSIPSLSRIPLLSKFAAEIDRLKSDSRPENLISFANRLRSESIAVLLQALDELVPYLQRHQDWICDSAVSEKPDPAVSLLLRALLDTSVKLSSERADIANGCGRCLGIIGCLDPNRIEIPSKKRQVLVLSNFDMASEVIDWAVAFFEDVLVKAFKSATNARAQGFLAYAIQELLRICGFNKVAQLRLRASQAPSVYQKWADMPEHIRSALTPFLNSRYVLTSNTGNHLPTRMYPSFSPDANHSTWLRGLAYDLLRKAKGDNSRLVCPEIARIIRGHDLSIATFMLPYAVMDVVLGGTTTEVEGVISELKAVLQCKEENNSQVENIRLSSENVFAVLDYMSRWLQEKRKILSETRATAYRTGHSPNEFNEIRDMGQIETIEHTLAMIPADVIAFRALQCRSFSRALFHWEQYIRQKRPLIPSGGSSQQDNMLYQTLLDIYAQVDDPDGLEGISAHLSIVNEEQQALEHCRAGRWPAAQSWYELRVADEPYNIDIQVDLLRCLKETGQHDALLRYADSFANLYDATSDVGGSERLLPFVLEACWENEDLKGLTSRLSAVAPIITTDFSIGIGQVLAARFNGHGQTIEDQIAGLRVATVRNLTAASTTSLQACHDSMLRLHVLHEVELLISAESSTIRNGCFFPSLDKRLAAIGSYTSNKQYVLGLRRAVMRLREDAYSPLDLGTSWVTTARLARKSNMSSTAYGAVLRASQLGEDATKLEQARLLWRDGHRRQAVQALERVISSNVLATQEVLPETTSLSTDRSVAQSMLSAKAHLLLAKWLDQSGQTQVKDMTIKYQYAAKYYQRWDRGHYYLGKHYSKLLEAECALPKSKQTDALAGGEHTKLVIENLLRSIPFGFKYWHETIPKVLTLWMELGMDTISKQPGEKEAVFGNRLKSLETVHKQLRKYIDRIPPYIFYTALPQIISRISHPNPKVWEIICMILTKIVSKHPSQALWSLLAVVKSTDRTRVSRGCEVVNKLRDLKNKGKGDDGSSVDLRAMISQGTKLSDGLLQACEVPVEPRSSHASLSRDLGFNHKLAPSALVVPIESTMTASTPAVSSSEQIRHHKAFVQDKVTIASFSDDVLVLNSLVRPRKITVRGSDGKMYGLLCKPKDDLRKDQRLMEFNGVINRALKRDEESSKRRLYIKTYAVTPLSEESGTIEWVEGIKPMRDILLALYRRRGVIPNYNDLRIQLGEACSDPAKINIYTDKILATFQPILHEWFTEVYPEPDVWFANRLRYSRSCAVMSMVGHVLGLGDRHGENILLEESTGGVFHVDFNCLFDKGLTFEKPEVVPFRLTHNMVDAMGPYGYEGPFRKSSELTLGLLRQHQDTLMTILETFLYDPTTDFIGKKKRTTPGVPDTPQEILDSVASKLKGLLRDETVPLSVEGYVDALTRQATSPMNLCQMYIGWCCFL